MAVIQNIWARKGQADYKNVCGTDDLQCSAEGDDDTDGCDSDDDEIANHLAPKKPSYVCCSTLFWYVCKQGNAWDNQYLSAIKPHDCDQPIQCSYRTPDQIYEQH